MAFSSNNIIDQKMMKPTKDIFRKLLNVDLRTSYYSFLIDVDAEALVTFTIQLEIMPRTLPENLVSFCAGAKTETLVPSA
jgi:hypothetical protein